MDEKSLLIEQYKLYVEMADRVSIRRDHANRYYLSVLSGLLTLIPIVSNLETLKDNLSLIFGAIAFLGLLLNFLWFVNINSYRQLNTAKFKVIHQMEQELPVACYDLEWQHLGGGKDRKKYFQLTRVEAYLPVLFAVPFLVLLVIVFR